MRKPLVVIPVPNHAEQWINARTIEHLGVGMRAQEADLEPALAAAARQIERLHQGYRRLGQVPDGAAQAADLIMSFATSGGGAAA
jgi:UDP:flavonoid glycosyltransferase YjiC (YdhE family)